MLENYSVDITRFHYDENEREFFMVKIVKWGNDFENLGELYIETLS